MSKPPFQVGERVTFTKKTIRGSRISLSTRVGKVIEVNDVAANVMLMNGRKYVLPLGRLTKVGQPSEVTRFFEAFVQAVKESETEVQKS